MNADVPGEVLVAIATEASRYDRQLDMARASLASAHDDRDRTAYLMATLDEARAQAALTATADLFEMLTGEYLTGARVAELADEED